MNNNPTFDMRRICKLVKGFFMWYADGRTIWMSGLMVIFLWAMIIMLIGLPPILASVEMNVLVTPISTVQTTFFINPSIELFGATMSIYIPLWKGKVIIALYHLFAAMLDVFCVYVAFDFAAVVAGRIFTRSHGEL